MTSTTVEMLDDSQGWDDCDSPLIEARKVNGDQKSNEMKMFSTFDSSIDGIKSGLIKPPRKRLVTSIQTKKSLHVTTVHPSLPDLKPYDQDEERLLPLSLLLATRNILSKDRLMSVGDTTPYFFYGAQMFPSILRNTSTMSGTLEDVISKMTPAVVHGLHRHALAGRSWPAAYETNDSNHSVVGMLAFAIPEHAQRSLDRFQNGTSARRKVKASFNLSDGTSCMVDCYVFVSSSSNGLDQDEAWSVSKLMSDPWHLQNLSSAEADEDLLRSKIWRSGG